MDGLIDTSNLIDILRGYPKAAAWMQSATGLELVVPSVVRMELGYGAKNKTEQTKAMRLCAIYAMAFPTAADAEWALRQFEAFHLSHQIEILDCFIAAMSMRLQLPIYTRNVKDFSILPDVTVHVPYT